ncbi:MAG: radical SAM protein [Phycisphaerae bacterium]
MSSPLPVAASLRRYARYTVAPRPREVVLLRGLPCVWSRCTFCDYIADNTADTGEIRRVADAELARVTGEFGRLQVINSGSIQELPADVRADIRRLIAKRAIREFYTESYWAYRRDFDAMRRYFAVEHADGPPTRVHLFLGVETFDDRLRNGVLNKAMRWDSVDEVAAATDSINLLVGFRGQTRDSVRRDIDLLLEKFHFGIVNLFTSNSRSAQLMDDEIRQWFCEEFAWLRDHPRVDLLRHSSDFGVG